MGRGVRFLGSDTLMNGKNWEGGLEKVCAQLSEWNFQLPSLLYRGRVLVVNK